MQTAKDIMTTPVISVTEDKTIQDVIDLIAEHCFSGVPVVNKDHEIIGIISDTDIIRYSHETSVVPLTNLSGWVSPHADLSDLATMRKGLESLHRSRVSKVMTKKVYTIKEDEPITEVAKIMNRRRINRLPVINNDNKLVGIVTRADLLQCMASM